MEISCLMLLYEILPQYDELATNRKLFPNLNKCGIMRIQTTILQRAAAIEQFPLQYSIEYLIEYSSTTITNVTLKETDCPGADRTAGLLS